LQSESPLPFDCKTCKDKIGRNCKNRKKLEYTVIQDFNFAEKAWRKKNAKHAPKVFRFKDLRLYECPVSYITNETRILLELLFSEEHPPFIFPGGWLDQPVWWIEAIQIYKTEKKQWLQKN
jgi:hypothetical protein